MATNNEEKYKNLVYLMIRRYKGDWRDKFPSDMGVDGEVCEKIFAKYADDVIKEIEEEDEDENSTPTAEELIDKGLKRLRLIMNNCQDPAKLTSSIDKLVDLRNGGLIKQENHKTIFDKIQENYRNEGK